MVRGELPSRGCRVCRQRKIKCDEQVPECIQCRIVGRQCPGPITGVIIRDMTNKLALGSVEIQQSDLPDERLILHPNPHSVNPPPGMHDEYRYSAGNPCLGASQSLMCGRPMLVPVDQPRRTFLRGAERIPKSLDAFPTLNVEIEPSSRRLVNHCINVMGPSLIPFRPQNPMHNIWLPMILSDQLLLQTTIFLAAVNLAAAIEQHPSSHLETVLHRGKTLSLLNNRLSNPICAVDDITIATVSLLIQQSIVSGNADQVRTHMDGLEKMIIESGGRSPSTDAMKENIFWTDIIGSAFCHTSPHHFVQRPGDAQLYCLPIFLYPNTGVSHLCLGFQGIFATPCEFNDLIGPIHDLRCLTIAFHYSDSKASLEMPSFRDVCFNVRQSLTTLGERGNQSMFEACRLASLIYVDLILMDIQNYACLTEKLHSILDELEDDQTYSGLMLWILFMANIASSDESPSGSLQIRFAQALMALGLSSRETLKQSLSEFLWVESICDQKLGNMWMKLENEVSLQYGERSDIVPSRTDW